MRQLLAAAVTALLTLYGVAAPAAEATTETRLRDALRNAITEVRSLQDQQAVLQAKQAESERQKAALQQQIDAFKKLFGDNPEGAAKEQLEKQRKQEQELADARRQLSGAQADIAAMKETIDKWKIAYDRVVTLARTKEAERAQLSGRVEALSRQSADCAAKNVELYRVGTEILNRYAGVGFGDVLEAREPFVGTKRVELQTLVQDYGDKLRDQRVTR